MPNWVYNSLVVSGDKVSLDKLRDQLNKPVVKHYPEQKYNQESGVWETIPATQTYSNPVFSFWNIIAPTDLDAYYGKAKQIDPDNLMLSIVEGFATGEDWYNWNVRNWGSKWDIAVEDSEKYSNTSLEVNEDGSLLYRFETAWSPVEQVITRLSQMYPSLSFDYEFEEEQGWGGSMLIENGEILSEDSYDIPSSHADYVARDKECICEYDDIQYAYRDCPVDESQYEWDEDNAEWAVKEGVEV